MEILCSFRLVLDGKTDKEIPEFLEKFLAKKFALSDAEDNTSSQLNRGGTADLPLLRTLLAAPQVPRAKFVGSDGLFRFCSICKFGSFNNPFAMITSMPELYFRFKRFVLLVKMKNVISMNYGSRQAAQNHGDE